MMKKKHLNILLLILVFVIYGGVFSKLFGKKQLEVKASDYNYSFNTQIPKFDIKRNSFDINSVEKDPFRINKKSKQLNTVSKGNKSTNPTQNIKKKSWPRISFFGFVKNDLKFTRLALVKVGNKLYRKREGEVIDNITIVKVYSDSIKLKFENENKIITRLYE
jgi:hypothetical protein